VTLHVVVIEDNADIADTLALWLEDSGHQAWIGRSGPEGVDLVAKHRPDLVLCDLGLPEMDGLEVCRRVRSQTVGRRPMMVALTGWGREDDRRRTKEAGFDEHLVKPVVVEQLRGVLQRVAVSTATRVDPPADPSHPIGGPVGV
jgi:CheY-like chemotaxis protein